MPKYSNTLGTLCVNVLQNYLSDYKGGTATGGSTTTFVDTTARYEENDYFQSTEPVSRVRIVTTTDGAAPQGEEKSITDWVKSTATGTMGTMTAAVGAGDTYVILSKYPWADVKAAINEAIRKFGPKFLYSKVDETVALADDTYEYTIPTGYKYIHKVSIQNEDGDFPEALLPNEWSILPGTTPKIRLDRMHSAKLVEGHWIGELQADSSTTPGSTIICDCEELWTGSVAGFTISLSSTIYRQGTYSIKAEVAAGVTTADYMYYTFPTTIDLSGRSYVTLWFRSSYAHSAGDWTLQLMEDTTAVETLNMPACSANTWTFCTLTLANPSLDNALTGLRFTMAVDCGAETMYIDDIQAPPVLRIEGLQQQAELTTDSSICYIDPVIICEYAAVKLLTNRLRLPEANTNADASIIQLYRDDYVLLENTHKQKLPPNSRRVDL